MKKWLDDNDILPHLTHNEGKSIVAERFIKTLKAKICKKLTANDSKSYLGYLNKLADEYNNSYHHPIDKKSVDADYSTLTEEIESIQKAPKLKVRDRVRVNM